MSKIIKTQIKRSVPMVLILVLVSSLVSGFAFNVDVTLSGLSKELGSKLKLGFNMPVVNADSASTTVTVRNAAPIFTANAAEVPISTSTSPINEGEPVSYTATANDPESQNYYLLVCSTNSATAVNGGAPTCGGTMFCRSNSTADDAQATCTYASVSSAAETQDWYAFVCDSHATEADCSTANQGSGDSGSPISVNHAPIITAATTTVNFQDPGGTFTLQGTATDADVGGGDDVLTVDICSTDSWATSTGCAATTLCTGTSTANPSCQFTEAAIKADAAYTYYAFVKDEHGKAASGNSKSSNYTVNNVTPELGTVIMNGGANIITNMKNSAEVTASTSVSVTDNNGCTDVQDATSTLYWSAVAGGADCAADDNGCYQITAASCSVLPGCTGAIAEVVCTTTISYLANSTDNATGSPRQADNWLSRIRVYDDDAAASSSISETGVELISLMALDVNEATIPYGIVRSGENTGAYNATTTIVNFGNTPLNSNVKGTDMIGPDTVAVIEQEFNAVSNFSYGVGTDLALTDQLAAINVSKPTGADLSSPIYWGINIPAGKLSGDYGGTNTFTALLWDVGW